MFINLIPSLTLGPTLVRNWGLEGEKFSCLQSLLLPHYTFDLTPVQAGPALSRLEAEQLVREHSPELRHL